MLAEGSRGQQLREQVGRLQKKSNGATQFPVELRQEILAFTKEQLAVGLKRNAVAASLGMKDWTLAKWQQVERREMGGTRKPRLQRMRIVSGGSDSCRILVSGPQGLRFEATLEQLASLWRKLI